MSVIYPNIGYGTTYANDSVTSGTYVAVANVTDIKLPKKSVKKVASTTLAQTTMIEQSIPGMLENGEMSMTVQYTTAAYALARGIIGTVCNHKIVTPEAADNNFVWNGYVCDVGEVELDNEKLATFSISVCCLSDVTIS